MYKGITLEYLKECFEIDETSFSGLRWKERPRHHFKNEWDYNRVTKQYAGKCAGCKTTNKLYWCVTVNRKLLFAHRIIYIIANELVELSEEVFIDHINRNGLDNKISNLRLATISQNNKNMLTKGKEEFYHVLKHLLKSGNYSYRVVFQINGKNKRFGCFKNLKDAQEKAKEISVLLYGEFSPYYLRV